MKTMNLARRRRGIRFGRLSLAVSLSFSLENGPDQRPNEEVPYTPEPWHAVAAVRPDTAHVRALRFLDAAGEMIAALILVIGGVGLTGYASLLGGVA